MLLLSAALRSRRLLPPALFLLALFLGGSASGLSIVYDIASQGAIEAVPFSGIFARGADDEWRDDDDDGHRERDGRGTRIFSDDLSGLIGLTTDDDVLFVDGQQLAVEQFSLSGTASLCGRCKELAIAVELDPRFSSVLEVDDGSLEGEIRLLLTADGFAARAFTISALGKTADPESNFATPEFLSLLLALDFGKGNHDDDDTRERWHGEHDRDAWRRHGGHDDDDWRRHGDHDDDDWGRHHDHDRDDWKKRRHDDDRHRVFLQAQGPVVPEPSTLVLLAGGLLALAFAGRRR